MGHYAVGQPSSLIPGSLLSTLGITQDYAVGTSNLFVARYSADVNFKVAGDVLLFTTETGRGAFLPLSISIVCVDTYASTTAGNPLVSMGFESGNAYDNFLGLKSLTDAYQVYTGQWQKGEPLPDGTDWDIGGIELEYDQYARACPAATGVYLRISIPSTATKDLRVVSVLGVYLP